MGVGWWVVWGEWWGGVGLVWVVCWLWVLLLFFLLLCFFGLLGVGRGESCNVVDPLELTRNLPTGRCAKWGSRDQEITLFSQALEY